MSTVLGGCHHWPDINSADCCSRWQAQRILEAVECLRPPLELPDIRLTLFLALHATGPGEETGRQVPHALLATSSRAARAVAHVVAELQLLRGGALDDSPTTRSAALAADSLNQMCGASTLKSGRCWPSDSEVRVGASFQPPSAAQRKPRGSRLDSAPTARVDAESQRMLDVARACESRLAANLAVACSTPALVRTDVVTAALLGALPLTRVRC